MRAVILDMDGLMLDTERIYKVVLQEAAQGVGRSMSDATYAALVGRSEADSERRLLEIYGDDFPLARFRREWPRLWRREVLKNGVQRKPGLDELLDFLHRRGVAHGVATSTAREHAEETLAAAGLERRFDVVVTGDEVARGKPEPDIFLEAATRLGVPPRECVALEDSDAGARSAAAAGMTVLVVPDLKQPSDETVRLAHRIIPSLNEALATLRERLDASPERSCEPA